MLKKKNEGVSNFGSGMRTLQNASSYNEKHWNLTAANLQILLLTCGLGLSSCGTGSSARPFPRAKKSFGDDVYG
jgi:hypothetical protein